MWRVVLAVVLLSVTQNLAAAEKPGGNPLERFGLAWTAQVNWAKVVNISDFQGPSADARLEKAQAALGAGGGVVFFPAGVYAFADSIRLGDGIVLMGAAPAKQGDARQEDYELPTRFEFPRYVPKFEGSGTANETAFKGIYLQDPATAGNCGIMNLAINRGHVSFGSGEGQRVGKNRFVVGCIFRNAAGLDLAVPDVAMGQQAWQRFTNRHRAAITIHTAENALVANNRLPKSGEDNFLMKGYLIQGGREAKLFAPEEGVWFDFDNRPGISVNPYSVGGGGGAPPRGTPETHPHGFRKGLVIRQNYIYCSGHTAIAFCGDGTVCAENVIRFPANLVCWTVTGKQQARGSSTNGNRAVEMRGWRWVVEGNDYEVYRNRVGGESRIYINDGEGLMHEGHANSIVKDSRLVRNKGNAYLSIYATGGIDGLVVEGNDICPAGPGTDVKIASIYVVADQYSRGQRFVCRNVRIIGNTTAGSGIRIAGSPAEGNVVKDNRHVGPPGTIWNQAEAVLENNTGYEVVDTPPKMKK